MRSQIYRFLFADRLIRLLYYLPMERMTKVDENIQTAQNLLSWIVERCYELEEENKKLKEYNRRLKQGNDDLKEQNKKLKEDVDFYYKSAKQFREQVEKWEKDFVEWRIVEKD